MADDLGRVAPNSTPIRAEMLAYSDRVPMVGEYVLIDSGEETMLAMVSNVQRGALEFSRRDLLIADDYDKVLEVIGDASDWAKAELRIVGVVKDGHLSGVPRRPPPTGAKVIRAPGDLLRRLFSPPDGREGIRIGKLVGREDVDIYLDPNEMVSRHLAILAVTGGGKSNTVAVILDEITKMGGSAILFDVHSEYQGMELGCGDCVMEITPEIDPNSLTFGELASLLGITYETAAKQYMYLKKAYNVAVRKLRTRGDLSDLLSKADVDGRPDDLLAGIQAVLVLSTSGEEDAPISASKPDRGSLESLIARIEHVRDNYGRVLVPTAGEITDYLDYGRVVVVDLGQLDSDLTDLVVGKTLMTILSRAKSRVVRGNPSIPLPVLAILEEAHALIPSNEPTYTAKAAASIAKEGRKFGVGLCLVSQRPKRLDPDVLSQMVNKIILRIVEPDDQSYVRRATEFLSEDLMNYLPSLDVGEAVIVGPMIRLPALVKVRLFEGKRGGMSLDAYSMWREGLLRRRSEPEEGVSIGD